MMRLWFLDGACAREAKWRQTSTRNVEKEQCLDHLNGIPCKRSAFIWRAHCVGLSGPPPLPLHPHVVVE